VHKSSCKVPDIVVIFLWKLKALEKFSKKKSQIISFIKIRKMGDEFFKIRPDTHEEAKRLAILRTHKKKMQSCIFYELEYL